MCLDHGSFLLIDGDEETTLEHVASILPGNGELKLVDVLGKVRVVPGNIGEIDFLNKRIVLA
ncbi:putative RNA-binding protein [Desulfuromonas soudanensis]|uniref:Putative RNA-binding protein n=1 Tax=Desulfuromonas soudanensis TaxID=1603606 RepID=A0A0M5IUE9_9BACT|nr:CooT family nickel-binding protein [Desulfuromonas soudanensis]ALC17694.1 putative RNA-binding protein [Desulfuromonas soudanensis]